MGKTYVKCAVAGGVVVFIWCIISWMVLPWHQMTMNKFSDEKDVAAAIQESTKESGIYVLPNCFSHEKGMSKENMEKERVKQSDMMHKGPFMFAVVSKTGMGNMGGRMIFSLIADIVAAFFATWLFLKTKAMDYGKQVGFFAILGLFVGFVSALQGGIWWGMPAGYVIVEMLDIIIAWVLAGLVIAKLAKK